ncbi:hypothetical protein EMIT0P171_120162 [Pseudomonas sp. IT-P171]
MEMRIDSEEKTSRYFICNSVPKNTALAPETTSTPPIETNVDSHAPKIGPLIININIKLRVVADTVPKLDTGQYF